MLQLIDLADQRFVHVINQFATKSAVFDGIMYDLADATFLQGGLFMAYFWWAWLRTDGPVVRRRQDIMIAIAGAIAASVISRVMQVALPFHPRPLHMVSLHFVVPTGVNPQTLNTWSSFPSDHAAIYFALATAIWYQWRAMGYAAMVWTFVFGLIPRIYLGYHWPSDIIAGSVCGVVVMVLSWRLVPRTDGLARVVAWEQSYRAIFYPVAFLLTYQIAVLFYDVRHLVRDGYDLAKVALDIHPGLHAAVVQQAAAAQPPIASLASCTTEGALP